MYLATLSAYLGGVSTGGRRTVTASLSTRERLIDEAMRLFGEQGYRATSVAQIEEAAGLTPGSGGLYHHFRSKELLLEAGIERHANRLRALRDIRVISKASPTSGRS